MKDIDKLIEEKLAQHEVVPPAAAWDALAAALQQKRRQRRIAFWWAAAALLVVGVSTILIVGSDKDRDTGTPVVQESPLVPRPLALDQGPSTGVASVPDREVVPISQSLVSEQMSAVESPTSAETNLLETSAPARSEALPVTTPPVLTERTEPPVSASARETKARKTTWVVNASRYRKDTATQPPNEPTRPSEVTVIYQPNPSALAKKRSLGQRIDKTLTFIQDHGIGFSELRSAKSELVDKVLSREEPNQASDTP